MPPVIAVIVAVVISAVTAVGISGVAAAVIVAGISAFIVAAGTGLVIWGVGTLLSAAGSALGSGGGGIQLSAIVNPLAPWNIQYGRGRVGGTIVYRGAFGDNDKYLDLVIVLAAHPSQTVDSLLFDNNKVQIGGVHSTAHGWAGSSFQPLQQTVPITSTGDITRSQNVVTVVLHQDIPLLEVGDKVVMAGVHPVNLLFNGTFPVTRVVHTPGSPGAVTFSYLAGGPAGTVTSSGQVSTVWADYGSKVYMEVMLGGQALGDTFEGMITGTPYDGDWSNLQVNSNNPWASDCSLLGKTAVFLRLHYSDTVFASSVPMISFLMHGKNDISDPRTSPPTIGYTENAALCIADYLSNRTWGYKAVYGTEIPLADLIASANVCDEAVGLAQPNTSPLTTEPRYACNGGFPLSARRSEVLQNLLTSCAGRCTYIGGQFKIWPGAWLGSSASITGGQIYSLLSGAFQWRASASIAALFNGVKGTYISPFDNWQPADFPRYAQDTYHGYTWGSGPQHDANLDADGGDRRWLDVQLPFTISPSTAQRIAKIELLRRRHQGTGTFPLNMWAYQLAPMDVIAMDLSFFGWSGKLLEISNFRLKVSEEADLGGKVPVLTTEIDVQETDSSIYAWSIGEELSPQGYQQAIVADNRTPAPPTSVYLESDVSTFIDGPGILVTWIAPADAFVLNGGHIEVQYRQVQSPPRLWISMAKMDPSVTQVLITGVTLQEFYDVEIRAVNAAGVPSSWIVGTPITSSPPTPGPIEVLGTPPAGLTFTPALYEYGTVTVENVTLASPNGVRGISIDPVYVDELTADVIVTTNASVNATDDPKTIACTGNPSRVTDSSVLDFEVGQFVLWNDPGKYEIGQITAITGTWPTLTLTIQRHYPGEAAGLSTFEAPMTTHASGTQLFIAQYRSFQLSASEGGLGGLPTRFDMALPAACVLAITAAPYNDTGFGSFVTFNCAGATLPGFRTCIGGEFSFQKSGSLAAASGVNVFQDFTVPFDQPYRAGSAYVGTAPTGASLKVRIRRSSDGGTTFSTFEEITIPVGTKQSWSVSPPDLPGNRRQPYSGTWPFPIFRQDDRLNVSVEQVGSTITGADLTVKADT